MPLNAQEYEDEARKILPPAVYGYYAGGAEDERALEENTRAFRALCFRPRVLTPVGDIALEVPEMWFKAALRSPDGELVQLSFPAIVAPMAMQRMANESDGELGMARAAQRVGIPMCLSTLATRSIEEVAEVSGSYLFQLYAYKDRSVTLALVERARNAGYSALVLTVDSPVFGRREREMRQSFTLPSNLTLANFEDDTNKNSMAEEEAGVSGLQRYGAALLDPNLSWDDVKWLVDVAKMPVWVKGVMCAEDALLAVDAGVHAIIVSNHGGRHLDSVMPTLQALPDVAAAVIGKVPILVDSGIRRGGDIVKALALGASGVMIGRPLLWALAVDGSSGVTHILETMKEEFRVTMQLIGARSILDISREHITTYGFSDALR